MHHLMIEKTRWRKRKIFTKIKAKLCWNVSFYFVFFSSFHSFIFQMPATKWKTIDVYVLDISVGKRLAPHLFRWWRICWWIYIHNTIQNRISSTMKEKIKIKREMCLRARRNFSAFLEINKSNLNLFLNLIPLSQVLPASWNFFIYGTWISINSLQCELFISLSDFNTFHPCARFSVCGKRKSHNDKMKKKKKTKKPSLSSLTGTVLYTSILFCVFCANFYRWVYFILLHPWST